MDTFSYPAVRDTGTSLYTVDILNFYWWNMMLCSQVSDSWISETLNCGSLDVFQKFNQNAPWNFLSVSQGRFFAEQSGILGLRFTEDSAHRMISSVLSSAVKLVNRAYLSSVTRHNPRSLQHWQAIL